LAQLADGDIRDRLRAVWEDPYSLDPAKKSAKVTRDIAGQLAILSRTLEARGFEQSTVAIFLMRCLFTMFVEDAELITKDSFTDLLSACLKDPRRFPWEITDLWQHMDRGTYSPGVGAKLLRFNGKLFKNAKALELTAGEIQLLAKAAAADWRDLEPAIFGTLFEQALDPQERRQLGAHYTPRAYVERIVDETIIVPLRQDWINYQSAAQRAQGENRYAEAVDEVLDFLRHLSRVRVLDPACGTGNFLYVALRRMKQLEGEALKYLQDLGGDDAVARAVHLSIKPEQFFGMELNPRAVEIAELVLWIGYIQWHMRTRASLPTEPVLGSSDHVRRQDAVLTWQDYPEDHLKRDATGKPVTGAGGHEVYTFPEAGRPVWSEADFIVGNPPFIGGKDIRGRLRSGYAEALWRAHPQMNPSTDFVMYWWDHAAELLTRPNTRLRRFGFVTTNSITQVFQRRIVDRHLTSASPISLVMAIPDHPWTKASRQAAAVRIAMTVASAGSHDGVLKTVLSEDKLDTDEPKIMFAERTGRINADLTIGADVTRTRSLLANEALCSPGVKLHGDGFVVSREDAAALGLGRRRGLEKHIRQYRNGRDLMAHSRDALVIDLFGLEVGAVRRDFPEVYQHLLEKVKPERDRNNRASYRDRWWWFGEPRREMRAAMDGSTRYIVTVETAKHRVFQFLSSDILPDNMLVAIALSDPFHLGVLSSRIHVIWALRAGGRQGVGNDPRYNKSRCFDPFPFPHATGAARQKTSDLAEELDATRKRVQADHADVSLTELYNVMEAVRDGVRLSARHHDIKDRGRVLILKDLHDRIDEAVMQAYGWPANLSDEDILARLVELNQTRAEEERRGLIRWPRPDYQIDKLGALAHRGDRVQTLQPAKPPKVRPAFPDDRRAQAGCVLDLLSRSKAALTAVDIAGQFKGSPVIEHDVADILASLDRLGEIESFDNGRSYFRAAS
jgi:SAM-dependent methyltransferase